jgi:hypothetical protein
MAAFGIGLIPYALLIRSLPVWVGLLLIVAVTFAVANRSRSAFEGESPSRREIAFAMLGRCTYGATTGIVGIGIFYSVTWIRSLFALDPNAGPDPWAVYASAALVTFFVIAIISSDVRDITNVLYPDRPGQRSPFFPLSKQPSLAQWLGWGGLGWGALAIAIITAAVVAAATTESLAGYFVLAVLLLDLALIVVGADYVEAKTLDSMPGTSDSAIAAIKVLLEAADYSVIPRPRTGDAEADSVISILDFLAIQRDRAIAGRVSLWSEQSDKELRHEAASFEPAVWVLEDQLRQQQSVKIKLKPVLLVLGGDANSPDDSESSAATAGKSVRIIRGPSEAELTRMIAAGEIEGLKSTAERLFGKAVLWARAAQ